MASHLDMLYRPRQTSRLRRVYPAKKSPVDFGGQNQLANLTLPFQIELGTACGKLFRCSTMAVLDAGDSDILADQQS